MDGECTMWFGLKRKEAEAAPTAPLSQNEAEEFMRLLKRIEDEKLWNLSLHIAVADYMFRTSTSYQELLARYEAVCPDYQKKDFPLKRGLKYAGRWVEENRSSLSSQIYKEACEGKGFDPKKVIEEHFESWLRREPY